MKKVFLGGTCPGYDWRSELIEKLEIDYFNPVVDNWTQECYEEELRQRKDCDYCLYVITRFIEGVYSIAEALDDSNKRPEKTLFCVLPDGFSRKMLYSLDRVSDMIEINGGKVFSNLDEIANFLNKGE